MKSKRFAIGDDPRVNSQLVEIVPDSWSSVNGILIAPPQTIASGSAIERTGFEITFTCCSTCIVSWGSTEYPDLHALVVLRRLPGFIRFHGSGYKDSHSGQFREIRDIAAAYVRMGYRGFLIFVANPRDTKRLLSGRMRTKGEPRTEYVIKFRPWDEFAFLHEEPGERPADILLEWDEHDRGAVCRITPLLKTVRDLGLEEYKLPPRSEAFYANAAPAVRSRRLRSAASSFYLIRI